MFSAAPTRYHNQPLAHTPLGTPCSHPSPQVPCPYPLCTHSSHPPCTPCPHHLIECWRFCVCCSPFDDDQLKGLMVQKSGMGLTQKGFTSRWSYLTNANPRKALEHMMYLGLHMEPSLMQRQFSISKTRQQERRRGKDFHGRGVFQVSCYGLEHLPDSPGHLHLGSGRGRNIRTDSHWGRRRGGGGGVICFACLDLEQKGNMSCQLPLLLQKKGQSHFLDTDYRNCNRHNPPPSDTCLLLAGLASN